MPPPVRGLPDFCCMEALRHGVDHMLGNGGSCCQFEPGSMSAPSPQIDGFQIVHGGVRIGRRKAAREQIRQHLIELVERQT